MAVDAAPPGRSRGLNFPPPADVDGALSRAYGVFLEQQHLALRGLFVIDPNGVLQFQAVHNLALGRRINDVLRVVWARETGGLCDEDWTAGQAPIGPHAAHTARICQRDLKPANILISDDEIVKVVDFDLARREVDPKATLVRCCSGRLRGTPAYMSPEQARGGPATAARDVLSLGLILRELLRAAPVVHGDTVGAFLEEILALQPKRLAAEVPEPFAAIFSGSLVRERVRRISMDRITEMLGKTVP